MNYKTWLTTLTIKQLRALAAQAGITAWATRSKKGLLEVLLRNNKAEEIFKENYGSVQV